MTITAQVVSLLRSNKITGVSAEHVWPFMINKNERTVDQPIIVVSEIPAGEHDFGNGNIIGTKRRIQITFYYNLQSYEGDMDLTEKSVESFLRAHGFKCYSNAGHVITPDTENVINTLKFNYLEV